jgi:hypothetical protein
VKSDRISIQGRFMATPFTNGLAAMHQIVVGGLAMGTDTVTVGPMDNGQITCNGQPIALEFPSQTSCGSATVDYDANGAVVDQANKDLQKKIVHIRLQDGTHVQVMRWANHLNARITMRKLPFQDGVCGNFNGDASDDTEGAILARLGGRVPQADLMFHHRIEAGNAVQKTIADCPLEKREHATKICKDSQPSTGGALLDSCIFDVCFGGDQYASQDGLSEAQALQEAKA